MQISPFREPLSLFKTLFHADLKCPRAPLFGFSGTSPKRKVPRPAITSGSCLQQHRYLPTAYFSFPLCYYYAATAAVADEHAFLSLALGFPLLSTSTTQGRSHWRPSTHNCLPFTHWFRSPPLPFQSGLVPGPHWRHSRRHARALRHTIVRYRWEGPAWRDLDQTRVGVPVGNAASDKPLHHRERYCVWRTSPRAFSAGRQTPPQATLICHTFLVWQWKSLLVPLTRSMWSP